MIKLPMAEPPDYFLLNMPKLSRNLNLNTKIEKRPKLPGTLEMSPRYLDVL